jgi:hypothetical protein
MAGTKNRNRLDLPNRVKGSLRRELESWAEEFVNCCNQKEDNVPDGWMTINQIAKGIGKSPPTVRVRIMEMEKKGRLEKRKFKIKAGSRVRSVIHYRKK